VNGLKLGLVVNILSEAAEVFITTAGAELGTEVLHRLAMLTHTFYGICLEESCVVLDTGAVTSDMCQSEIVFQGMIVKNMPALRLGALYHMRKGTVDKNIERSCNMPWERPFPVQYYVT